MIDTDDFDLELVKLASELKLRNVKCALLQFPEGLLRYAFKVASFLEEKTGASIIISADPCWGACDLADSEAKSLGADVLVHFGHAPWPIKTKVPTLFIEAKYTKSVMQDVVRAVEELGIKALILASTVQHSWELPLLRKLLEEKGVKVVLERKSRRAPYPGQVLGCDFSNVTSPNVDTVLFIGGGFFHAVGISMFTGKRVFSFDPYTGSVHDVAPIVKKLLLERYAHISQAKHAKNFGVIVSMKPGQKRLELAKYVRNILLDAGKSAYMLAMRDVTPDHILNFSSVEALVVTACPRIAIEDACRFSIPILTPEELEVVLGRKRWEDLYPSVDFSS